MSLPVKTGLPDQMPLDGHFIVRWSAVDPTTGADVSGVVITEASVYGEVTGDSNIADSGSFLLVPGPGA
jgi:hypothetical protein